MMTNFHQIQEEIVHQYISDDNNRPWILGFSGGKDSTLLLQLVWNAIKSLPKQIRPLRELYVVCNNTLVENPIILEYTEKVLNKIQQAAAEQSLPIYVQRTTPKLEDTFWINLIGKGYPAPNNVFRWCTERLKISPTSQFIIDKVNKAGEVIILLGTRSDESSSRAKSIQKHEIEGSNLRKHLLPNAYVFTPIHAVSTDEVWQYLNQVQSPWGASNKELITLYRNANSGDCPLVIDTTTPSCGNSRFGCWVCTVVNKDKSMEALIDNGEDWMEPLIEIRNLLAEHRNNPEWREMRRRNGEEGIGPYKPEKRALLLQMLLQAQKDIQMNWPEMSLVNFQELVAIQVLWYRDNLFHLNVADIYNKIYNTNHSKRVFEDNLIFEKELLQESCKDNPDDFKLLTELLALQKSKTLLAKAKGLQNDLENHIEMFVKINSAVI